MKRNQINSHDKGIQSKTFSHFLMQEESRDGDKHCGRHEVCHHYLYTQEILHFPVCQSWYSIRFSGKTKKKKRKKGKWLVGYDIPCMHFNQSFFPFLLLITKLEAARLATFKWQHIEKSKRKKKTNFATNINVPSCEKVTRILYLLSISWNSTYNPQIDHQDSDMCDVC